MMLMFDDKIKMPRKPGKKQKENPAGKVNRGSIREGAPGKVKRKYKRR